MLLGLWQNPHANINLLIHLWHPRRWQVLLVFNHQDLEAGCHEWHEALTSWFVWATCAFVVLARQSGITLVASHAGASLTSSCALLDAHLTHARISALTIWVVLARFRWGWWKTHHQLGHLPKIITATAFNGCQSLHFIASEATASVMADLTILK